ncbi:GerMN domain-containing protein [Candidatus Clostridium stratigraminis]|uniref:GerMN domain-containing protein n=1 Tax=Candidatus Clostridium stratigraminis TaxID=3381661 RepID=A0ABW8T8H2_9CLOT
MKKAVCSILLIFSISMLSGCDSVKNLINANDNPKSNTTNEVPSGTDGTTASNTSTYKINDFYPFKENQKYEYVGKGNEYAAFRISVDFIKDNHIQMRKNNGGTEVVNVLENKDGELKLVYSKEECYYREDFTSKPSNKNEILLKEPLVKGTSWTLPDGRKRYISNVDVPITTLLGSYKALEVTTESGADKTLDYYALNTGLVETIYNSNNSEIKSSLNSITPNSALEQEVNFYYPNINSEKLYFVKNKLNFKTNDITKITFEKLFKEPPSKDLNKLLGPNVKIKSLYLNGNTIYVDFTKNFVQEMNAGAGTEALILQCITNTLGGYYNASKVYITIEDAPYSSGHIVMKKGETFTVNTKNSIEVNK